MSVHRRDGEAKPAESAGRGVAAVTGHAAEDATAPDGQEPGKMMARHHEMARWADGILIGLGAWLLLAPAAGYGDEALVWSDVVSGALVVVLAALSLFGRRPWAPYGAALVGTWLLFAPLVFWAPEPAAYLNDTLVGALVIAFSLLIPHGMEMPGTQVPPGWSYNPSTWAQRAPILALALVGFLLSRYMAAYQLGHVDSAWDPLFGSGTERILESDVSRMFPISDAGLGATAYLLELLMTAMGDPRRWRTMPWMVAFFGLLVVPLGVTSIVLVILQPLSVGTWCTLCLLAAVAMLVMVPLALDEVAAMAQLLVRRRRAGASLWRTFWLGVAMPDEQEQPSKGQSGGASAGSSLWGVTFPWTLLASAALGAWLMAAPDVLGATGAAADSDRLIGALVATVALVALAEVTRPVRFLNAAAGLWLLAAPWLLGAGAGAAASDMVAGALLLALSLPRGPVRERYGGWERAIR